MNHQRIPQVQDASDGAASTKPERRPAHLKRRLSVEREGVRCFAYLSA